MLLPPFFSIKQMPFRPEDPVYGHFPQVQIPRIQSAAELRIIVFLGSPEKAKQGAHVVIGKESTRASSIDKWKVSCAMPRTQERCNCVIMALCSHSTRLVVQSLAPIAHHRMLHMQRIFRGVALP
jgi:hypothetical protein